jgi:hypothetical protein
MTEVIPLPNQSTNKLCICADAVDTLETAFRRIRVVIERCTDGPNKTLLSAQQRLLQRSLDEARAKIADIVANYSQNIPPPAGLNPVQIPVSDIRQCKA